MQKSLFELTRVCAAVAVAIGMAATAHAQASGNFGSITAGDLLVSSSTYSDPGFAVGAVLPNSAGVNAVAASSFCGNANCSVNVWNNDTPDANFGITAGISLQSVNLASGNVDSTYNVTAAAAAQGINLVTSFSSKSELAINTTPDGSGLTFMGYNTTTGQLDVSNSNTPGIIEPGNTDTATATYRGVAQLNLSSGALQYTTTNAYNGNNGRAAVLGANGTYYMVGNGGNGNGSTATTAGTGVQQLTPGVMATPATPGTTQVASYSIAQNGYATDKTAKDNNFRGETVYNGTLYVTKGSGNNGINTVYQVGPAGLTSSTASTSADATTMSVLPGFSTTLAKATASAADPVYHPFGLFFANSTTLYVADEGSGSVNDVNGSTPYEAGGLQKWSLVGGTWQLDYTLRGNLIGTAYTVQGTNGAAGNLAGDALTTYTDGLRNLTGTVNANGTVTLYATTSTIGSNLGDAGADPNKVVEITDTLADTTAGQVGAEDFTTVETAALGQVLRGVAINGNVAAVPEPDSYALLAAGLGVVGFVVRRRRKA